MINNVCVFGASRSDIDESYILAARKLGALMAARGLALVFGAGRIGLMGAVAEGVKSGGGRITGVIPEKLNRPGIAFEHCDRLIVTATMHERKAEMERLSDAFIVLPGGFGTLEEALEVLTLNQLGYISSPVVFLDINGLYEPILSQFSRCADENFINPAFLSLYSRAETPEEALDILANYEPPSLPDKIKEALIHEAKR